MLFIVTLFFSSTFPSWGMENARIENKMNELWRRQPQEEIDGPDIQETIYERVPIGGNDPRRWKAYNEAAAHFGSQGYLGYWWDIYVGSNQQTKMYYYFFSPDIPSDSMR